MWCEKLATAWPVTASVVNYILYFAVTASVVNLKYIQSILYFVFDRNYKSILVKSKVFNIRISNSFQKSILYFLFNTLPKSIFTTVVTAIGMWGYTPVRITGVLVNFLTYGHSGTQD